MTLDPRLNVSYKGYKLGGKVAASLFHSIDGYDRDEEMMTDKVHFTDKEARAEAWTGYDYKKMSLTVNGRMNHRRGSVASIEDGATDKTVMATVGYKL